MEIQQVRKFIKLIPESIWKKIYSKCQKESKNWSEFGWHNIKYYKNVPPNMGTQLQKDNRDLLEIPYERKVFYPRPLFRFSLGEEYPVAYFASEFIVALAETIPQFRSDEKLRYEKQMNQYLADKLNAHPDQYGFPLSFKINKDAVILNLSKANNILFTNIENIESWNWGKGYLFDIISSRDKDVYPLTIEIAKAAFSKGFDGIIFNSVRKPNDIMVSSYIAVLFKKKSFFRLRKMDNR